MEFNNPAFDCEIDENDDAISIDDPFYQDDVIDFKSLCRDKPRPDGESRYRSGPVPKHDTFDTYGNITEVRIGSIEKNIYLNVHLLYPHVCKTPPKLYSTMQKAFIQYVGNLGVSDEDAHFDYEYIEACFEDPECINCVDVYGQTIMHEISREWHTDIALYLKSKGVPIDQADVFGRTPLFVAVACNNTYMVEWLLDNGADIRARTMKGEEQYPIHFAAKYNSMDALELLLQKGAKPDVLDGRLRTPLHVVAEQGRDDICRYLLNMELPAGTYSSIGVSTLQCIIENADDDVGKTALQQCHSIDKSSGRHKYYLDSLCLRRGRRILKYKIAHISNASSLGSEAKTVLGTIVEQNNLELIIEPTIIQLLNVARERFGSKYTKINVIFYLLFTVLWTVAMTLKVDFNKKDVTYHTVLVLNVLGMVLALLSVYKLFLEYQLVLKESTRYSEWRRKQMQIELSHCHPRWINERPFLEAEVNRLDVTTSFWSYGWNIIEAFVLFLAIIYFAITMLLYSFSNNNKIINARTGLASCILLACWLRLNRSLMFFQSIGPFITMLGETINATVQFGFLFFEFFVPFVCAAWVTFGGVRKGSDGGEYETFNDALYQMFLLTIVGDYEYDPLKRINKTMSQLLVAAYLILVSCVCINLYIALLSEMFASVYVEAKATSYMNEARIMLLIQKLFPQVNTDFEIYLQEFCSPQVLTYLRGGIKEDSKQQLIQSLYSEIKQASRLLKHAIDDQTYIKNVIEEVHDSVNTFMDKHEEITNDAPSKMDQVLSLHSSVVPVPFNRPFRSTVARVAQAADEFELSERFTTMKDAIKQKMVKNPIERQ